MVVRFYVQIQGRTKTIFGVALNWMKGKLDYLLYKANNVAKPGAITDDIHEKIPQAKASPTGQRVSKVSYWSLHVSLIPDSLIERAGTSRGCLL
jgi:hypothetical protein